MKNKKGLLAGIVSAAATSAILINSKIVAISVKNGISICLNILIPSMFLFLVMANFLQKTMALNIILKPAGIICEKLFKLNRSLAPILLFSLICGYPAGASLISNLVEDEKISKKTATRMLNFCVNSGPAFLIGGLSVPLTGSIFIGVIIFISQFMAFLIVGIFCSVGEKLEPLNENSNEKIKISTAFVESIKNSIETMTTICGFTIFFSGIIGFLLNINLFRNLDNERFKQIFAGLIEITNGTLFFRTINSTTSFLIITLLTAFGGICVQFQIIAIVSKSQIKFKNFYIWRLLYCAVSLITAAFLFNVLNPPIRTLATITSKSYKIGYHSPIISIFLIILSITLLCCDKKNIIINRKSFKKNSGKF